VSAEVRRRRRLSGAEKMAVLKKHLKGKASVSQVCSESRIQPSQFHKWQEELFENGSVVFERGSEGAAVNKALQAENAELKRQLEYKTKVLFELMEEHVKTKKKLGLS
jgi:transposase-like protein